MRSFLWFSDARFTRSTGQVDFVVDIMEAIMGKLSGILHCDIYVTLMTTF